MIQIQFIVLQVLRSEVRRKPQKVYYVILLKIFNIYLFIIFGHNKMLVGS